MDFNEWFRREMRCGWLLRVAARRGWSGGQHPAGLGAVDRVAPSPGVTVGLARVRYEQLKPKTSYPTLLLAVVGLCVSFVLFVLGLSLALSLCLSLPFRSAPLSPSPGFSSATSCASSQRSAARGRPSGAGRSISSNSNSQRSSWRSMTTSFVWADARHPRDARHRDAFTYRPVFLPMLNTHCIPIRIPEDATIPCEQVSREILEKIPWIRRDGHPRMNHRNEYESQIFAAFYSSAGVIVTKVFPGDPRKFFGNTLECDSLMNFGSNSQL